MPKNYVETPLLRAQDTLKTYNTWGMHEVKTLKDTPDLVGMLARALRDLIAAQESLQQGYDFMARELQRSAYADTARLTQPKDNEMNICTICNQPSEELSTGSDSTSRVCADCISQAD